MKDLYELVEMEVINFNKIDVIRTSDCTDVDDEGELPIG